MAKRTAKPKKIVNKGRVRTNKRSGALKTKKITRTRSMERTIEEAKQYEAMCKVKYSKYTKDRKCKGPDKVPKHLRPTKSARPGVSTLPVRPAVASLPVFGSAPAPSPSFFSPPSIFGAMASSPPPPSVPIFVTSSSTGNKKTVLKAKDGKDGKDRPLPAFGIIEVCFCIDATGSMSSYLAQTKSSVVALISKIEEKVHSEGIQLRFAVVTYRDHPPQDSTYVTKIHDFTNDKEIRDYINKLDAFGGGDEPEAAHDGLLHAVNFVSWTNTSKVPMVRYIFHIADAPAHGNQFVPQEAQKGCRCGISTDAVIHALNMKEIHYRLIKVNSNNEGLNKMGDHFKKFLTNYDETSIQNANDLDVRVSDMVIRELMPDV